jgi:hypothetical protein
MLIRMLLPEGHVMIMEISRPSTASCTLPMYKGFLLSEPNSPSCCRLAEGTVQTPLPELELPERNPLTRYLSTACNLLICCWRPPDMRGGLNGYGGSNGYFPR